MSKKIKLLYFSDSGLAKTGFGRITKSLLEYLYRSGEFDVVNAAMMSKMGDPELEATPWKTVGTIPASEQFQKMYESDEKIRHIAGYGFYGIDEIIRTERPQIMLAAQDIWALTPLLSKPYFNKIPSIFWTTLDSLPIHEKAIESSKKCEKGNFWVWSNFAEKDMKSNGFDNVKTIHAPVDESKFRKLEKVKKDALRRKFNIPIDSFLVLDVFRSQLRKSVFSTLEGYALFKKNNPGVKASLLLHTCFSEGWNIMGQAKYYGVPAEEVLTTYICDQCRDFEVKAFKGEKQNCPFCGAEASQVTTSPRLGVSEEQLNEIYNLGDVLCHPANSGGLELILPEALYCELPTMTTSYSYGEEFCSGPTLELEWQSYRDLQQNEFIKAATSHKSVAKQLSYVYRMDKADRQKLGKMGREWALERFSIQKAGANIKRLLLEMPLTDYNFKFETEKPNPDAVIPEIEDPKEWLKKMYKEVLKMDVSDNDKGLNDWLNKIKEAQND